MSNYEKYKDEIAFNWRKFNGRSGAFIIKPINQVPIILYIIQLFLQKDNNRKILIITENYIESNKYREAIINLSLHDNVTIISKAYIKQIAKVRYDLIITLNIFDKIVLNKAINQDISKYYLCVFDRKDVLSKECDYVRSIMPFVRTSISADTIVEEYIYSPVKETLVKSYLINEDLEEYNKADAEIKQSLKIFESLEVADKCRVGDRIKNIGYETYCYNLAKENGWNEYLDTKSDFGEQIDSIYNPNGIHEKACNLYNMIRLRKDIVTKNKNKLAEIYDIIAKNQNKNILIISTTGEFAYDITVGLKDSYNIVCGNYHDAIPNKVEVDKNGNKILYKSGANKGQPKVISYQRQSTINEQKFNDGEINILSIKAASNTKLSIKVDVVIFTSPFVPNIKDIKRRFKNITFLSYPLCLYTIYTDNTTESKQVNKYSSTINHEIVRSDENIYVAE